MTHSRPAPQFFSKSRDSELDLDVVLAKLERGAHFSEELPHTSPFGNGRASESIVEIVKRVVY